MVPVHGIINAILMSNLNVYVLLVCLGHYMSKSLQLERK
jgi:hypothetical protein